jgi:hypothetical protein
MYSILEYTQERKEFFVIEKSLDFGVNLAVVQLLSKFMYWMSERWCGRFVIC